MIKINDSVYLGIYFLILMFVAVISTPAQDCNPQKFSLVFKDSAGKIIDPNEVKVVNYKSNIKKDKNAFVAKTDSVKVEEYDAEKNASTGKINVYSALSFTREPWECFYTIGALTLERGGKSMRLIFNVSPDKLYSGLNVFQGRYVPLVDVTFQAGIFQFVPSKYDKKPVAAYWIKPDEKDKTVKTKP